MVANKYIRNVYLDDFLVTCYNNNGKHLLILLNNQTMTVYVVYKEKFPSMRPTEICKVFLDEWLAIDYIDKEVCALRDDPDFSNYMRNDFKEGRIIQMHDIYSEAYIKWEIVSKEIDTPNGFVMDPITVYDSDLEEYNLILPEGKTMKDLKDSCEDQLWDSIYDFGGFLYDSVNKLNDN